MYSISLFITHNFPLEVNPLFIIWISFPKFSLFTIYTHFIKFNLSNIILKGIKETNGNGTNGSSHLNYKETDKSEYNDEMDFFQDINNNPNLQNNNKNNIDNNNVSEEENSSNNNLK